MNSFEFESSWRSFSSFRFVLFSFFFLSSFWLKWCVRARWNVFFCISKMFKQNSSYQRARTHNRHYFSNNLVAFIFNLYLYYGFCWRTWNYLNVDNDDDDVENVEWTMPLWIYKATRHNVSFYVKHNLWLGIVAWICLNLSNGLIHWNLFSVLYLPNRILYDL